MPDSPVSIQQYGIIQSKRSPQQPAIPILKFIAAWQIFPAHVHIFDKRTVVEQNTRQAEHQYEKTHTDA
ncbi:Uncharacterised protein [Segatella copri]|nr:Uncharacterised protein [Segatella copri]